MTQERFEQLTELGTKGHNAGLIFPQFVLECLSEIKRLRAILASKGYGPEGEFLRPVSDNATCCQSVSDKAECLDCDKASTDGLYCKEHSPFGRKVDAP